MTSLWHLWRKDVRYLRWLLLVWVILLLLETVLTGGGAAVEAGDYAMQAVVSVLSGLVPVLQMLLVVLFVPLLVHQEPLVGTTAFWFTRPISRELLLREKALFLGLWLLLPPVLTELTVMAVHGVALPQLGQALAESVVETASFGLAAWALAAVTLNVGRFLLVGVLLFVGFSLVSTVLTVGRLFGGEEALAGYLVSPTLQATRELLGQAALITAGAAVVVNQYLTRRTVRSGGLIAAGLLLMLLAQQAWRWDLLKPAALPPPPPGELAADGVTVRIQSLHVSDTVRLRGARAKEKTAQRKQVTAMVRVNGVPPALIAVPQLTEAVLTMPDGRRERGTNAAFFSLAGAAPSREALEAALGGPVVVGSFPGGEAFDGMRHQPLRLLSADAAWLDRREGTLTAKIKVNLYRYQVVADLPFTKGAAWKRGSDQAVLTNIERGDGRCTTTLKEQTVNLRLDGKGKRSRFAMLDPYGHLYVLVNRERKEAFVALAQGVPFNLFGQQRLVLSRADLNFGAEPGSGGWATAGVDDAWLQGARLLRVERVPAGEVTTELRLEQFPEQTSAAGDMDFAGFPGMSGAASVAAGADPFARISLPPNPTAQQARDYVTGVLQISLCNPNAAGAADRLAAVGHDRLDVLLAAARQPNHSRQSDLRDAIDRLTQPADRDALLAALPDCPNLVTIVLDRDWTREARPILVRKLAERPTLLPVEWIRAVAAFEDPATYPDLQQYVARSSARAAVFPMLRRLPGLDVQETVAAAWKRAKYANEAELQAWLPVAIEFGHADALPLARVVLERRQGEPEALNRLREVLATVSGVGATDAELLAWLKQNESKVAFDRAAGRFVRVP